MQKLLLFFFAPVLELDSSLTKSVLHNVDWCFGFLSRRRDKIGCSQVSTTGDGWDVESGEMKLLPCVLKTPFTHKLHTLTAPKHAQTTLFPLPSLNDGAKPFFDFYSFVPKKLLPSSPNRIPGVCGVPSIQEHRELLTAAQDDRLKQGGGQTGMNYNIWFWEAQSQDFFDGIWNNIHRE